MITIKFLNARDFVKAYLEIDELGYCVADGELLTIKLSSKFLDLLRAIDKVNIPFSIME